MSRKRAYRTHHTKTIGYCRRYDNSISEKGDLLLDLFAGSGTFLEAAYNCGLNYIGFENDEKWYKIAADRLNNVKSQLNFFRMDD